MEALSGQGLRAHPGEPREVPCGFPCSPLDERLSCSQLWAQPSSPGASGLQASQQHHEPGQRDRGLSTRGAKKGGPGWGRTGGAVLFMLQLLSKCPSAPLVLAGSNSGGVLEERVRKGLVTQEMPMVPGVVTEGESYTGWSSPVPLGPVLWVRAGEETQRDPHTGEGVSSLHIPRPTTIFARRSGLGSVVAHAGCSFQVSRGRVGRPLVL